MIEIQIYGTLWQHLEPKMELDANGRVITVADLLARLEVDPSQVGIVTVNGRQSSVDKLVPDGCRVCIFPPMSGG